MIEICSAQSTHDYLKVVSCEYRNVWSSKIASKLLQSTSLSLGNCIMNEYPF